MFSNRLSLLDHVLPRGRATPIHFLDEGVTWARMKREKNTFQWWWKGEGNKKCQKWYRAMASNDSHSLTLPCLVWVHNFLVSALCGVKCMTGELCRVETVSCNVNSFIVVTVSDSICFPLVDEANFIIFIVCPPPLLPHFDHSSWDVFFSLVSTGKKRKRETVEHFDYEFVIFLLSPLAFFF